MLTQIINRVKFAHIVSMASGIVAASQVPDPSETGLFDAPQRPRLRNYRLMDGNYTYVPWVSISYEDYY